MDLMPREYKNTNNSSSFAAPKSDLSWSSLKMPGGYSAGDSSFMKLIKNLSIILLVVSILAWVGLQFYQRMILGQISDLKQKEASVFTDEEKTLAANIIDLQNRAKIVDDFLRHHIYTSELFSAFASVTLPQVRWSDFQMKITDKRITAKGQAASYPVLARQLKALEDTGEYSKIDVSGILLSDDGKIDFSVNLEFDASLLQKTN